MFRRPLRQLCFMAAHPPERILNFLVDSRLIGCTSLQRAFDLTHSPPLPVFCRRLDAEQEAGDFEVFKTLATLAQHPNLPRLLGQDGAASGVILAFQPSFSSLHSVIRQRGALAEPHAAALLGQLLRAVAHCHGNSICLRDIKLGKLMFADRQLTRLVLADLTGARVVPHGQLLSQKVGSPAYVAPEVLLAEAWDGYAADMWSLGVVAYVMLTGAYPFATTQPSQLFALITADGDVPLPATLSPAAAAFLRRMLTKDPAQRATVHDLLQDPWLQAAGPVPPTLPPPATATAAAAAAAVNTAAAALHPKALARGFHCPVCHKVFGAEANLRKHMQLHARSHPVAGRPNKKKFF